MDKTEALSKDTRDNIRMGYRTTVNQFGEKATTAGANGGNCFMKVRLPQTGVPGKIRPCGALMIM